MWPCTIQYSTYLYIISNLVTITLYKKTVLLECICASVDNDCSIKPYYVFAATSAMYE